MTQNALSCFRVSDAGICPYCYSKNIIKNGHTKTQKQQYYCKNCQKRFLDYYSYKSYYPFTNQRIINFIREGLGIRSISRLLSISASTVLKRLIIIAKNISAPKLSFGKSYEMDEMCFFLGSKKNLYWLAYAIEKTTKKVIDFRIGKRTKKTLNDIIQRLLLSNVKYIYTDKLIHYQYIIPNNIHKTTRYQTNHIERKNLTIRTHLKRFSRRSICFGRSWIITFSILKIYFWSEYSFS